ncbi:MAG TPA: glycosyltransferase family 2 protein [Streptosporangiales bacterium]
MVIDVLLPCLDEAGALPWVLGRMPAGFRPLVADNGSTDGSAEIAVRHGARVVHVPQRGYGAACHAGLVASDADVVCVMDADASLDPAVLPSVAAPVLAGDADLVLGRRVAERGAFPVHARVANRALAALVTARCGVRVHDIGPMRAFRREALVGLALVDRRFGYPLELLVRAAAAGWRIREVPVPYLPRAGRSKVTGTVRGTVRTVRDMTRVLAS